MCIIVIKPAGQKMPDSKTLRACWDNNPDGAGLMFPYRGLVRIEKGFMHLRSLEKRLATLSRELDFTATTVILHFRIGTHGGNIPANTHPFPVVRSISELQKTTANCRLGVAHNGIIDIRPSRPDISDTMEYVVSRLAHLRESDPAFYMKKAALQKVADEIRSKMVFLAPDGKVSLVGYFIEDKGLYFSNYSFRPPVVTPAHEWPEFKGWMPKGKPAPKTPRLSLVWLNPDTEYVVLGDGQMVDADGYLMDAFNDLYIYDDEEDGATPVPTARFVPVSDDATAFDPEQADVFDLIPA